MIFLKTLKISHVDASIIPQIIILVKCTLNRGFSFEFLESYTHSCLVKYRQHRNQIEFQVSCLRVFKSQPKAMALL